MRQVIYVDVMFFLNFIMNFFLTAFTSFFRQKHPEVIRWSFASLFTAGVSTVLLFFFRRNQILITGSALFQILLQIRLSFRAESIRGFFQDVLTFFLLACLSGGVITAVLGMLRRGRRGISAGFFFFSFLLLCLCLFWLRLELLSSVQRQKNVHRVKLYFRQNVIETKALYDTGNQLCSPYTGEKVTIISKALAEKLHAEGEKKQWIPFTSIGGKGLLEAFYIDAIEMIDTGEKREHVLVAESASIKESSEIQVILHSF